MSIKNILIDFKYIKEIFSYIIWFKNLFFIMKMVELSESSI